MLLSIKNMLFLSAAVSAGANAIGQTGPVMVNDLELLIHEKVRMVKDNCRITTNLQRRDLTELPVGISPKGCNSTTIIVIDSAYRAERGGTFFHAYASIVLPGTTKPIAFVGRDIGFGRNGLTGSTQVKLKMVTAQVIPINENIWLELPADGRNYLEFDCDGFKSINLKGRFVFSEKMLVPTEHDDQHESHVSAGFEINTSDLNNIIATVNITSFKLQGLKDFEFEVIDAVVDYSDLINPSGFVFPQGYDQSFGNEVSLWRGFFLRELKVSLTGFVSEGLEEPLQFVARNVIIDEMGVSGVFGALNLLEFRKGNADGWPLSIDRLSVRLQTNKLVGGELGGLIGVPFLGNDSLVYTARLEQDVDRLKYFFSVALTDAKEFNTPFDAKVKLQKSSVITLQKDGTGKVIPSALLHGTLSSTGLLKIHDLRFENLGLISKAPYVISGIFSNVSEGKARAAGFPVQIKSVKLKSYNNEVALAMTALVNFMNVEDRGFSAETHIDLLAGMDQSIDSIESGRRQQIWSFRKIRIGTVALDCHTQAFALKGKLSLVEDDPLYGTGFHGSVNFSIRKVLENGVSVHAYFGSKETFRYWHVDGYVPVGNIPIPPAISITGFMGGASYRMTRQQPLVPDFSELDESKAGSVSTGIRDKQSVYVPDENAGTGFLAGVTLVIGNENAVNADAMLEIAFNRGGGIKTANFNGSAFFLTPIKSRGRMKGGQAPVSSIYGTMNMLFDNDNDVFHANISTYINIAGVLTGIGPNGLVGEAVIHTDPSDWYVYIGRPSRQFGLAVAGLAKAQTYFMIGTKVDDLPLPPSQVREIFEGIDMSLKRDDVAAAAGKAFAAGIHFNLGFDTGDKLRPFYIVASIGAGADVMLRNYGQIQCANRNGPIGINGWYANGQAYVFIIGKIGIRVKGNPFDIVSLGLAAALQAKLPNPSWMTGMLAGNYNIMGGLVKGKFNLKFTIGEQCEVLSQGEEISEVKIIADVRPGDGDPDVSVFAAPQVSFNTAIGKEFPMADINGNTNSYRVVLDEFSVTSNAKSIPGAMHWNGSNDVATIRTSDILPPRSSIRIVARIHWEKKSGNSVWRAVVDNANTIIYESKESQFVTGAAPPFIPDQNVVFSYPVKHQANFHVDEYPEGYLKLHYPQQYLFREKEGDVAWEYTAKFTDHHGKSSEVPMTWSMSQSSVNFRMPALETNKMYRLSLIKKPKGNTGIDQNLSRNEVALEGGRDNEVLLASNRLQGTITQNLEKEIFSLWFQTSQFRTFQSKWQSMEAGTDAFDVAHGHVAVIGKRLPCSELFDESDLGGKRDSPPLIQLSANPEVPWLQSVISPLLYDLYPYENSISITWRDTKVLGVKPLKGVSLSNSGGSYQMNEESFTSGQSPKMAGSVLLAYYLSYYSFWDYSDLCNQAAAKYYDSWNTRPEGVRRLMSAKGYTDLTEGVYPVNVRYVLPGETRTTFSSQLNIKF